MSSRDGLVQAQLLKALSLSLALALAVAGCAGNSVGPHRAGGGYYQNDGPPDDAGHIDLSRIPNAVPRNAPLAKYGNPDSYTALGKTYYVLKSAAGFTQTGRASWYGRQFAGVRTSSGAPYNMFRMTAAHKRLPIPTWVRVTNLDNGRHCIVKINDRGPFHDGRIIDLSYVAARRLGIVANGSAPVRIRTVTPADVNKTVASTNNSAGTPQAPLRNAINPADYPASSPSSPARATARHAAASATDAQGLYLQAGAFGNANNARDLENRLSAAGIGPITVIKPDARMSLYRVRLGPFANPAARENVHKQMARLGFSVRNVKS